MITGASNKMYASVGLSAVGIVSGPSNTVRAGFGHGSEWLFAAEISMSPSPLPFGDVQVGQSKSLSLSVSNTGTTTLTVSGITVTGSHAAEVTASPTSFTVNAGAPAQPVTVTLTPTSVGARSASLSIAHDGAAGSPTLVSLTGNGTAAPVPDAPAISLPVTSLTMDATIVAASSQKTFTIGNTGTADLTITGITVTETDGSHFTVSPTTATVATGALAATITVTFTPSSAGVKSASVSIAHNATGSPSIVTLSGTGVTPVPIITLSPASIDFGDVEVGQSSGLTLSVGNGGTSALIVVAITVSGTDAAHFSISPISATIVPGAPAAAFTVTFTPSTAGGKSASLSITHNAAGSPSAVALTGNGTSPPPPPPPPPAPIITLALTTLTLENTEVGSASTGTFTLDNTGNADLSITAIAVTGTDASTFTVTPTSGTVGSGAGGLTVVVTFSPTSEGPKAASLSISHNASGSPATVALTGTGVAAAAPAITVSITALSFGDVQIGGDKSLPLILSNSGDATLNVSAVTVSGPDSETFSVSPITVTVPPGDNATVTVTFFPADEGAKAATLSIAHDAAGSPLELALTGNGTEQPPEPAPIINLSVTALEMEDTKVGGASEITFTIVNTGDAELTIAGENASDFTVDPATGSIAEGADPFTFTVTFSPTGTGPRSASLSISHNAGEEPVSVDLTGTGVQPIITLSATSLDFGEVETGLTTELTLTVGNEGDAELLVSDITLSGDDGDAFTVSATAFGVQPGESVPFTVSFTPESEGAKSASLSIVHDGAETPATVTLTGTGVFSGIAAMFEADPVSGRVGVTVQFTDRSAGEVDSWAWDFGDGIGSEEQSPAHTYTADGSFTVTLVVTGPAGTDTHTIDDLIVVDPNLSPTAPVSLAPEDDETGVSLNPTLTWEAATDPEGDPITYDLFVNGLQVGSTIETLFTIGPLSESTVYTWHVVAGDGRGGSAEGGSRSFTTEGDTQGPVVLGDPGVEGIGETTATVLWSVDEESTPRVEYRESGETDFIGSDGGDPGLDQRIDLGGLSSGTTYEYRVISEDGSGNETIFPDPPYPTFTTLIEADVTGPVFTVPLSAVRVLDVSISLFWATDE